MFDRKNIFFKSFLKCNKMEGYPKLKDILEKRNEIMNTNKSDEYIQVPDDDEDVDDVSTGSFKLYHQKKEEEKEERYNLGKSMHELTQAVKLYLDKESIRKSKRNLGKYFVGFAAVSGLIVLNDYIVINYFL